MATEALDPFLKGDGGRNTRGMLRIIILCTIAAAAVASRLFSVIRESQLHHTLHQAPRASQSQLYAVLRNQFAWHH